MVKPPPPLLQFEKNYSSQTGEDGVLERVLGTLGERDRWCVEFGAWDGKYCSNTYHLITQKDYAAVLIEADPARFVELQANHAGSRQAICVRRFVEWEGPNSLDSILEETPIPRNFDVLSIDIDGNDYYIWESLVRYRPKVVVIEYNPCIPNEVDWVQARDVRVNQGCSLAALARLAHAKGYRLIHATSLNGIFVDGPLFPLFGIDDDSPESLRTDLSHITYVFPGYDGTLHFTGSRRLPWHDWPLDDSLQALPRALRAYPPMYNRWQRLNWKFWRLFRKLFASPAASNGQPRNGRSPH